MNQGIWWQANRGVLATGRAAHATSIRDVVRHALVDQFLSEHAPLPSRVLDIGDNGVQARMLARRGHEVTLLSATPERLRAIEADLGREDAGTRNRVTLVAGPGEKAVELLGEGWDMVCFHGGLPLDASLDSVLDTLARLPSAGGVVSMVVGNAAVAPFRPALQGRWADALTLLTAAGHDHQPNPYELAEGFAARGVRLRQWYGVGLVADHLVDIRPGTGQDQLIALEGELGRRDPYRACAPLIHIVFERVARNAASSNSVREVTSPSPLPGPTDVGSLWDGWRVSLPEVAPARD